MMLALAASLSPSYEVIAFDRPGHGGSEQTPSNQGCPYAQAEMIAAGWRGLGIDRPVVVGHSFGGAVGLSTAIAIPEAVTGVVALAPICFPELRLEQILLGPRAVPLAGPSIARFAGSIADVATLPLLRNSMFLPQVMPIAYSDDFPFAWASEPQMMIADAKDSIGMWRALTRSAASYSRCRTPTYVLGGTHDMVVSTVRHGYAAAGMMPNAVFSWAIGCGHMIHHFRQDLLLEVLARVDAS